MRRRFARSLSDRPVAPENISHFINRELVPLLRELLRSLTAAPVDFQWQAGAASLDVGSSFDFAATTRITENSTLTLRNGHDGCSGTIFVQQDSSGGWTLSVSADGRTILRQDPFVDDNPDPAADAVTRYSYRYATISGVSYLVLERMVLL